MPSLVCAALMLFAVMTGLVHAEPPPFFAPETPARPIVENSSTEELVWAIPRTCGPTTIPASSSITIEGTGQRIERLTSSDEFRLFTVTSSGRTVVHLSVPYRLSESKYDGWVITPSVPSEPMKRSTQSMPGAR